MRDHPLDVLKRMARIPEGEKIEGEDAMRAAWPVPQFKRGDLLRQLDAAKCSNCGGLGEQDDASPGDISFTQWTCVKCGGTGLTPGFMFRRQAS